MTEWSHFFASHGDFFAYQLVRLLRSMTLDGPMMMLLRADAFSQKQQRGVHAMRDAQTAHAATSMMAA